MGNDQNDSSKLANKQRNGLTTDSNGSQNGSEPDTNINTTLGNDANEDWYVKKQKTIFDGTTSGPLLKIKSWMDATCNSEVTKAIDKHYHVLNVFMIFAGVYLLGVTPGIYFIHWAVLYQIFLYIPRIVRYLQYGYIFYFNDMCYIAFVYQIMFIYVFPGERFVYISFMALTSI